MRDASWGADWSGYVNAVAESVALLGEAESEELAASLAMVRYMEGEIGADRLRDEVGESAIRAHRVLVRLGESRTAWDALVAERGAFPSALLIPLERNAHRIGAVCDRVADFERKTLEAVEREARIRADELGGDPGPDGTKKLL